MSPSDQAPPDQAHDHGSGWRVWLMIGGLGFGGPAGQVALLHRELVERRRWLGEEEFLAAMRLCMLLPGPEAQQLATYAGWRRGGIPGGLLAGTLFVLPGAALVTALAWAHAAGESLPLVAAAFAGTRPAVVALVALAAWRIGRKSLTSPGALAIAAAALAALAGGLPFPLVVVVAGAVGAAMPFPDYARGGLHAAATLAADSSDGIRGTSTVRQAVMIAAAAIGVWCAAYAVVWLAQAAGGRGRDIATLFTETTLMSLGGAYAVVPWALEESVTRGWLEPDERFDALAMGEATPGPLILVVTFIGFLAGWRTGPGQSLSGGLEGAAIATLFAFIPSFAMVLPLAPFVSRIRPGSWLARAMTGIGAAVVAAILLLAFGLARAAWLPEGVPAALPIIVTIVSGIALVRGWASTPLVVIAAAVIGMVVHLLGAR
ncbi:MAG: chromate efflux transporter [Planctomycetia bacterium]|nr:chromate efflux transporter [Planctomycetia bacterium]